MTHKPVPDFPHCWVDSNGVVSFKTGQSTFRELRVRSDGKGYLQVDLPLAKEDDPTVTGVKTRKHHRVVWAALNNRWPPAGCHVDHIDHDTTNNHPNNLRLRVASENSADCRKTTRKGCAHLPPTLRAMIVVLSKHFRTKEICDALGVAATTVRRIRKQAGLTPTNQRYNGGEGGHK